MRRRADIIQPVREVIPARTRWAGPRATRLWLACVVAAMAVAQAKADTETVVHTFGDFPNGANPYATLIRDSAGNLYGTTYQGGAGNVGVVFRLNASGYKALYSFLGGSDGAKPYAGVTLDPAGNHLLRLE